MPFNLSIKNAPDEFVRRLRQRASRHLEECVRAEERLTPDDLLAETRLLKLRTPSESTAMIRADRDAC